MVCDSIAARLCRGTERMQDSFHFGRVIAIRDGRLDRLMTLAQPETDE
jgi:hypothetical protein